MTTHDAGGIDLCNNAILEISCTQSVFIKSIYSSLDRGSGKETDIVLCIIHR